MKKYLLTYIILLSLYFLVRLWAITWTGNVVVGIFLVNNHSFKLILKYLNT